MGRPPCYDKADVKKGPWTPEEDAKLLAFTSTHGTGNWATVPRRAGHGVFTFISALLSDATSSDRHLPLSRLMTTSLHEQG
jgi:hypothetical protein